MKKKIAVISYNLSPSASLTRDAMAVRDRLNGIGYDCELIHQWSLDESNTGYFKFDHEWERYDGIVICYFFGYWDVRELIKSGRPILCMNAHFADNFGLGTRRTEHKSEDEFVIVNNTHNIITSVPLSMGPIDFGNTIWTDSVNTTNQHVDTLVKSLGGQAVLTAHKSRQLAYFGWYRMSQAGSSDTTFRLLETTANWVFS